MCKNVLITGTSSGIGRCCAVFLAEAGFRVFAGVRTEKDFASLKSENSNITPIMLDVLEQNSLENAFQLLKSQNVTLNAIVNNAGAVVAQPIECINIEDLRYQFELNTIAPVAVVQNFLPLMDNKGGGRIVNISSMASTGIFPYIAPYCASKRALDILFNSMSIEIKNPNIKIVSIKPGSIMTPIWNKSIEKNRAQLEKLPQEYKEKYEKDLTFLAKNAEKNNYKATAPKKVAQKVLHVINTKNPKSSYCVGFDSTLAVWFSKFPQDWLNWVVRFKLKREY